MPHREAVIALTRLAAERISDPMNGRRRHADVPCDLAPRETLPSELLDLDKERL